MQLEIRHVTRFEYATPVWDSQNSVRACPADDQRQRLRFYRLTVEPSARITSHVDRWGTRVDEFGVARPHSELEVVAESAVTTWQPAADPVAGGREELAGVYRWDHWVYLLPTRHTAWGEELVEVAHDLAGPSDDVASTVLALAAGVRGRLEYRPGATEIGADVSRLWHDGVGVCQDFAHLTVALLRAAGIAARYVSGYLYAADPSSSAAAGEDGPMHVQTHAWVEAAVPGHGWWAIDPTNGAAVGERHVVIGRGRDYDDVAPMRGVYFGETEHRLTASVTMSSGASPAEGNVQQ